MKAPSGLEAYELAKVSLGSAAKQAKEAERLAFIREEKRLLAERELRPQNPLVQGWLQDVKARGANFQNSLEELIEQLRFLQNATGAAAIRLQNSKLPIELKPLCNTVAILGAYIYALENYKPASGVH